MTGSGDFRWESSGLVIVASNYTIMKLRIPHKFHGPLAALAFLLLMSIPALCEWIGGLL